MPKTSENFIGKRELWRAIREKCLECCGGGTRAVEFCTDADCPLYRLRFGRKPKSTDYVFSPGDESKTPEAMAKIWESRVKERDPEAVL